MNLERGRMCDEVLHFQYRCSQNSVVVHVDRVTIFRSVLFSCPSANSRRADQVRQSEHLFFQYDHWTARLCFPPLAVLFVRRVHVCICMCLCITFEVYGSSWTAVYRSSRSRSTGLTTTFYQYRHSILTTGVWFLRPFCYASWRKTWSPVGINFIASPFSFSGHRLLPCLLFSRTQRRWPPDSHLPLLPNPRY